MSVQQGHLLALVANARTCLALSSASVPLEPISVLREVLARTLTSVLKPATSVLGGLASTPRGAMSVSVSLVPDLTPQVVTALTHREGLAGVLSLLVNVSKAFPH